MTKRLLFLFVPAAFAFGLAAGRLPAQEGEKAPATDAAAQKAQGYALGYFIGKSRSKGVKGFIDPDSAGKGFADGIRGEGSQSDDDVEENLYKLRLSMIEKQVPKAQQEMARRQAKMEKDRMAKSRLAKKAGVDYLEANKAKEGVKVTASGLQYRVIKEGAGAQPKATDTVTVHYEGKLVTGKVFDSSIKQGQPTSFPLNRVIRGWTEGLQLMKVGAKYEFTIPFDLAYGPGGKPPTIPAYATLVFEVELLKIGK